MGRTNIQGGGGREVREFYFIFSSLRFSLRFTKIGLLIFIGAEGKAGLRDESYM